MLPKFFTSLLMLLDPKRYFMTPGFRAVRSSQNQQPQKGLSFSMADSKEGRSLAYLLDGVEKAHRTEVQLYTSGHLNLDKLYKPQRKLKQGYWDSARKTTHVVTKKNLLPAQSETARKIKHTSAEVSSSATLVSARSQSASRTYRCLQPPLGSVPVNASLVSSPLEMHSKDTKSKIQDGTNRLRLPLKKEELDVPVMKVLKHRPVKNSRQCFAEVAKDKYQFMPSYLAGLTRTDQFNKFLCFQRDIIGKHDLLENDFTGSKASEQHERKLAKDLQQICDCDWPHFKYLKVFRDVFEDICNSSLIFGDILKEVKNVYELYMAILLDSLPATQYKTLLAQARGMEKRATKRQEIEQTRRDIQFLMKKSKSALERNEELRHELEIELWVSPTPEEKAVPETHDDPAVKMPVKKQLSLAEKVESMRCQVLAKWEEIQALEKEIKETMTHAGVANTIEKTVKEIEAEAMRLISANKFLQTQIKDVEYSITDTLNRQKISQESQQKMWDTLKTFLSLEDSEAISDKSEK
ncbi:PREDICTED: LOW QUALITY PROTEIN: uncharacterized protein C6orf118 homolog [Crocodylus porosus]|uniref:LOW QUALITY PROTEIN: uncharacterized protein C6orf118 homolog n=1 Tax=Crocodylus porosus TaxID=8502 RepID=UPI00093B5DDF|nr:PREDICTED: LOW QUALITY PROTEIN: uncharacterized protein C6orf118 homolog [Crocodylus porosus]